MSACAKTCEILDNKIRYIKSMMANAEKYNAGIKDIKRADHYVKALEHLKSDLEENNICHC